MKNIILNINLVVFLIAVSQLSFGNNKHFYGDIDGNGFSASSAPSDDYKLYQNFPNPFNPSTKISYKINKEGFVSLQVFNLVGQVVRTLVNETLQPGRYEVEFDAQELPSGVYLYKLSINGFTSVKRMTLLR